MNEEQKMLPCPFCGGEADIKQNCRNGYYLKCKSCLIGMRQKVFRYSMEWLRAKMIENWNTRANNQDAVDKLVKAAKMINKAIQLSNMKDTVMHVDLKSALKLFENNENNKKS